MSMGTVTLPVTAEDIAEVAAQTGLAGATAPAENAGLAEEPPPEETTTEEQEPFGSTTEAPETPTGRPGSQTQASEATRLKDAQRAFHEANQKAKTLEGQVANLNRFINSTPAFRNAFLTQFDRFQQTGLPPELPDTRVNGDAKAPKGESHKEKLAKALKAVKEFDETVDPASLILEAVDGLVREGVDAGTKHFRERESEDEAERRRSFEAADAQEWNATLKSVSQLGIASEEAEKAVAAKLPALAHQIVTRARHLGLHLTPDQAALLIPTDALFDSALARQYVKAGLSGKATKEKEHTGRIEGAITESTGVTGRKSAPRAAHTVEETIAEVARELKIRI